MHPNRPAAESLVWKFTAAGAATGAIPVPASTVAIVAENAVLIGAIASVYGVRVSVATVGGSLGVLGSLNLIGRSVFVEGAKLLGWASGPLGLPAICVLGATTAGLQTWVIGQLAIAIAENGGAALTEARVAAVLTEARQSLPSLAELRERVIPN